MESFPYRVRIETSDPETLSTLLTTFLDCRGVEIIDADVERFSEEAGASDQGGGVVAYFNESTPDASLDLRKRIEQTLTESAPVDFSITQCELFTDQSWRHAWKEFFEPVEVSPDIWVGPPWEEENIPEPEDGFRLIVKPAMAFGTGSHETTRLAARLLADAVDHSRAAPSVLDVGCGSGILAMIASQLGASDVAGIDISEDAIDSARENLAINELTGRIDLSTTPLEEIDAHYDIVVANILGPILLELRNELIARVDSGGRLLLSGIAREKRQSFIDQFLPADWDITDELTDGDWVAFGLESP